MGCPVLIRIVEALVVRYENGRPDNCALILENPDPMGEGQLYLDFKAPLGRGAQYIKTQFGVEPTVSLIPRHKPKFSHEAPKDPPTD